MHTDREGEVVTWGVVWTSVLWGGGLPDLAVKGAVRRANYAPTGGGKRRPEGLLALH